MTFFDGWLHWYPGWPLSWKT